MGDGSPVSLGCDSLELLWLAAATNEMFHLYEAGQESALFSAASFGGWMDVIEMAWSKGVTRLTFATSGSTGIPKKCTHDWEYLDVEITYLADLFSSRQRVVTLARAHHIYGFLFTAMLPDRLRLPVVGTGLGFGENAPLSLQPGDLMVSIPEQWRWLNQTIQQWPKDVTGVVSTSSCSPELIESLIARGLGGMMEVYGSSETAGIGVRRWPEISYRLMPHWKSETPQGAASGELIHVCGKKMTLMDRLRFSGSDSFTLDGRCDGAVQVGGLNVFPDRIASLLRLRPGVHEVAVRLMRRDEGNRLKAFIVPEESRSHEVLKEELTIWCEQHLPVAERPVAFTFGHSIPANDVGAPRDWSME